MPKLRFLFIILFFQIGAVLYAAGTSDPALQVTTVAADTRQVIIDWSKISRNANQRYGLYRANREDKTISLVQEIGTHDSLIVDSGLTPPLAKYFYFIHHVDYTRSLDPRTVFPEGRRITDREIAGQLATIPSDSDEIILASEGVYSRETGGLLPDENLDSPYLRNQRQTAQSAPVQTTFPRTSTRLPEGIYIGLSLFANRVDALSALIPLDPAGRKEIIERLKVNYIPTKYHGTALYYAEHTALENITMLERTGALPANLDSIHFITFTSGLDTASTDIALSPPPGSSMSFAGRQTGSYMSYVSQQLKARRIGGKKINAWAIGIPGKDAVNNTDFMTTLHSVASSQDHIMRLGDLSQIERQLSDIADRLTLTTPTVDLRFTVPAYAPGTVIRITFDGYTWPEGAPRYVEGRISYTNNAGNTYALTALNAYGIALTTRGVVEGKRTEYGIEYTITINDTFEEAALLQWYKPQAPQQSANWLLNNDFQTHKISNFTSNRKSAIIYLLLDSSSSLNDYQINEVREAVIAFIDRLYNTASYTNTVNPPFIAGEYEATNIRIRAPDWSSQSSVPPPQDAIGSGTAALQSAPSYQSVPPPQTAYQPPPASYNQSAATPSMWNTVPPPQSASEYQPPATAYYQTPPVTPPSQAPAYQPPAAASAYGAGHMTYIDLYERSYPVPPPPASPPSYQSASSLPPAAAYQAAPPSSVSTVFVPAYTVFSDEVYAGFWVQVASFRDIKYAQNTWRRLFLNHYSNTEIFGKRLNGVMYYRVKIGPYQNRHDAEISLQIIRQAQLGFDDAFIVQH